MSSREDVERLRALSERDVTLREGLWELCLFVGRPERFDTWVGCPPRRGEPFASDGSEAEYLLLDSGAVCFYVPLADESHRVIGADLREMLALGLHGNWAGFDELAYRWDNGLAEVAADLAEGTALAYRTPREEATVARLAAEFDLQPWPTTVPEVRARLIELQDLLPAE